VSGPADVTRLGLMTGDVQPARRFTRRALWGPPTKPDRLDRTVHILDADGHEVRAFDPGPPGIICLMHRRKGCDQCELTAKGRGPKVIHAMNQDEG